MRLAWSPVATGRADQIIDFIAKDRPQAALDWIDGLEKRVESLVEFPEQGKVVPEWLEPDVRELIYERHRVIYEVTDDMIQILTIKHVRQQVGSLPRRPLDQPKGSP